MTSSELIEAFLKFMNDAHAPNKKQFHVRSKDLGNVPKTDWLAIAIQQANFYGMELWIDGVKYEEK